MKLIVAGGRDFVPNAIDREILKDVVKQYGITEIVSGGAKGADSFGEDFAKENKLKVTKFPANWNKYGRGAGPIRNKAMADYADAVLLYPGGRGTASMKVLALQKGLQVFEA